MTDTTLKFGPDWVRALSSGDGHSPPPSPDLITQPRYKLAEHRYGREEMLALYHKGLKPPADLADHETLFVDKTQTPLAFTNLSEEENRTWQRGINSDAVLKVMGRTPATTGPGGLRGGRGANSMDRGRGRARSTGGYGRGTPGYDEEEGQRREAGYGRGSGRGYDRDRAQSLADRGWDRNGGEEWAGTSPRKEYGPRVTTDNWRSRDAARTAEVSVEKSRWPEREHNTKDEEEGWKTAGRNVNEKWGRGGTGWRDGGRGAHRGVEGDEGYRRPYYGADRGRGRHPREEWDEEDPRPSGYGRKSYPSKTWDDPSEIPEWAAENSKEKNGSFDATGAFRGEEDDGGAYEYEDCEETEEIREPSPVKSLEKVSEETQKTAAPEEPKKALPPEQSRRQESEQNGQPGSGVAKTEQKGLDRAPGSPIKSHRVINLPPHIAPVTNLASNIRPSAPIEVKSKIEPNKGDRKRLTSEDEGLDRVADDLVARLVEEDEERKRERTSPHTDSWYYRDPQGQVQGPFRSSEMIEWYKGGYFPATLQVRRACDERFSRLDELTKLWGRNPPFLPGPSPPPITEPEVPSPTESDQLSHVLLQQQLQQHQLQQQLIQQQMLQQQIRQSITAKLSQMEGWSTLTPMQQVQLIQQHTSAIQLPKPSLDPLLLQQSKLFGLGDGMRKDPLQSLLQQLQQNKPLPDQSPGMPPNLAGLGKIDPLQSLLNSSSLPHTSAGPLPKIPTSKGDPIQSLLQQLSVPNGPILPQTDRSWFFNVPRTEPGAMPPSSGAPGMPMNVPGGLGWPLPGMMGLGSLPLMPGQGLPSSQPSFWDAPGSADDSKFKEIEELRRREDEKRVQDEERKKQDEQRMREELSRLEDERKRLEEECRLFEEKKRKEDEARKREEKQRKRLEEEKRRQEEEARRQEEFEEKRLQEERKRQQEEERRRKQHEEDKRKKAEEEKKKKAADVEKRKIDEEKRIVEERRQREEDLRQQEIEEERLRREEEQELAQSEAFERLQEQQLAARQRALKSIAPWSPQAQPSQPINDDSLSLAEIQERERQEASLAAAQERRLREMQQQQAAAIAAARQKQQKENAFKWGQKPPANQSSIKSLAEIQAEEAAELARVEERQRSDRAALQSQLGFHQAGVWTGAAQSLSWGQIAKQEAAQAAASNGQGQGGFWDDVPTTRPAVHQLSPVKPVLQQQQQAPAQKKQKAAAREEENVKKIFEKTMKQANSNVDKFTQWCCEYLAKMNSSIDIPTFVAFMKDVESAYEVNDYVRSYLGDGKEAKEFAKQFVERRSKWRALQKGLLEDEDAINGPARTVNASNEFQEVKGKSRKGKKGTKKVDASSLLGFSVTGAPDRLNVGERDYGN